MPTDLIPFGNLLETGYEEIAGGSPHAFNVIVDSRATMRRRPGITTYAGAPSSVIDSAGIYGLYVTNSGMLFAVGAKAESNVYSVIATSAYNLSTNLRNKVYGPGRPVFAETEMLLCITQGNEIKRVTHVDSTLPIDALGVPAGDAVDPPGVPAVNFVTGTTFASLEQSPPNVLAASGMNAIPPFATHVVSHASRLLANDSLIDKTKIRYSDLASGITDFSGHDTWLPGPNTAGFFSTESDPDPVVSLATNTNDVFAFGARTLQIFSSDPTRVYATSAAIELGCSAPYSIVKRNQAFWWLDNKRRFVFSDGRSFDESIGNPIKPVIDTFTTVADCFGYLMVEGTTDAIVWTFPTAGRTFCYQPGVGWCEWAGWSEAKNTWTALPITAHHNSVKDAVNIVGTSDGHIGKLTRGANSDLGTRIRAYVETGFLNRGTSSKKSTRAVRLTLRRGQTTGTTAPTGQLYWRDSLGAWEGPLSVSLGAGGDVSTVIEFRSVGGPYRTRQWRFEFDGTSDELVLTAVEEDFTILNVRSNQQ